MIAAFLDVRFKDLKIFDNDIIDGGGFSDKERIISGIIMFQKNN